MERNLITVIIPTYNRAHLIKDAAYSVLNQSYKNIELIIIDDCSTDDTAEVVKSINDPRLNYHRLEKNSGACIARNKGIELARGDYISFNDSDDKWLENKLEEQLEFLLYGYRIEQSLSNNHCFGFSFYYIIITEQKTREISVQ